MSKINNEIRILNYIKVLKILTNIAIISINKNLQDLYLLSSENIIYGAK